MTTIHLVRHGEVDNPDGILYGRLPHFGLTERGREMAVRVAEHFHAAPTRPVELVASPLLRAQQTIRPLSKSLDLPVFDDDRVIEAANSFEDRSSMRVGWPSRRTWCASTTLSPRPGRAVQADRAAHAGRHGQSESQARPPRPGRRRSHRLPPAADLDDATVGEGRSLVHDPRRRECDLASITSFTFDSSTLVSVSYESICADLQPGTAVAGA